MTPSPFLRKFAIIVASLMCVFYLAYRAMFTFNDTGPYAYTASILLYVAECFGIFNLFLFFLQVWDVSEPPAQPVLEGRTVDVMVPTYNEDVALLRATLEACVRMDYPHRTFVLDDGPGGRPEVEALARELGVNYIHRPDNLHAKAGNLNYALERTDGEFVVILDADHVPEPHFITRLIGYFRDERLGYVQTPHAFYNFDSFQARLDHKSRKYWEEGHLFYYVIQPGRNRWGCPIFAGSAAMFRRGALRESGLIATETITEDLHTGLRMNAKGWRSMAITERLVAGQAAPDITTFHSQRLRWGTGNLSIMKHNFPLTTAGLSMPQRLCYLGSMLNWASGFFKLIIYLTPIAMLFSGIPPVKEFTRDLLIVTVTYLIISLATMKYVSNGFGSIINSELFSMVNFWTQIKSMFRAFLGYGSRQFVVTAKGAAAVKARQQKSVWPYIRPQTYLIILSVLALFWGWGRLLFDGDLILSKNPGIGSIPYIGDALVWLLSHTPKIGFGVSDDYFKPVVPTFWVLIHFWLAYKVTQRAFWPADKRFTARHVVHVPIEYEAAAGSTSAPRYGVTVDLNDTGMAFVGYDRFNTGDVLRFTVRGAGEVVKCKGEIRTTTDLTRGTTAGGVRYGVQFINLTPPQIDALNRICLHYGVPRMYGEYDKHRGGLLAAFKQWQDRGMSSRRRETRNPYHMPIIVNSGTTEDTAQYSTTEDLSRSAVAALLDHDVPRHSQVGYLMSTPLGDVRGTARVLRTQQETYGGKNYYRAVLEFNEFEGQGRTTLNSLVNPAEAKPLKEALKPDRKPMLVRMAGPTLVVIAIAIPLILAQTSIFKFFHKDDRRLREIASKQPADISKDDLEHVDRMFSATVADKNPTSDRLVLVMNALKNIDKRYNNPTDNLSKVQLRDRQLSLAEKLAIKQPSDLSLQSSLLYAQLRAKQYQDAETTYARLTNKGSDLKPEERIALALAGARVSEGRGDMPKALERYKALYTEFPRLHVDYDQPDSVPLWREYAGVLIKAELYDEAQAVLKKSPVTDVEGRRLLVAAHLLKGRSLEIGSDVDPAKKELQTSEYRAAEAVATDLNRVATQEGNASLVDVAQRMQADIEMARQSWSRAQDIMTKAVELAGNDRSKVDPELLRRLGQAQLGSSQDRIGALGTFTLLMERDAANRLPDESRDSSIKGFLDAASYTEVPLGAKEKAIANRIYDEVSRDDAPLRNSMNAVYIARLGWVLQRVQENKKSESVMELALDKHKKSKGDSQTDSKLREQFAGLLYASGNRERAAEVLSGTNAMKGKQLLIGVMMDKNELGKALIEARSLTTSFVVNQRNADGTVVSEQDARQNEMLLGTVLTKIALNASPEASRGAFTAAYEHYEKMDKKYPNNPEVVGAMAFVRLWSAERTKGVADFGEALKKFQSMLAKKVWSIDKDSPASRAKIEQGFIDAAASAPPLDAEQLVTARELVALRMKAPAVDVMSSVRLSHVLLTSGATDAEAEAANLLVKAKQSLATSGVDEKGKREMAGVLATAKKHVEAAEILASVKKDTSDRMQLAKVYAGGREWDLATKELDEIVADKMAKPEEMVTAQRMKAQVVSWSGKHQEAIKMIDEILARNPDDLEMRVFQADTTLWAKDFAKAQDLYLALAKNNPNNPKVLQGFANAAAKSKTPLTPDSIGIIEKLTAQAQAPTMRDALLCARLAEVNAVKLNDPIKAKQLALKAFELAPSEQVARADAFEAITRKEIGYILANEKIMEYRKSDTMFSGVDLKGEERKTYALIASAAENYEAARRQARLYVAEQMPNTVEERAARRFLAEILTWKQDYEEALAIYEKLSAASKEDRNLKISIAEVNRFWQNYPVALQRYAELLNDHFEDEKLWIGLIDSASSAPRPLVKQHKELLVKVHDRLAGSLSDPRRQSRMAWVMLQLGEGAKANTLLTKAVSAKPEQPAVRKELAGVLAAADRRQEAIDMIAPRYVYETLDLREILNLADLLTAESQLEKAELELATVIKDKLATFKPEEQKRYRVRYAEILLWSQRPEKYLRAQEQFAQLVKDYPDDTVLPLRLAQTYLWSGDYVPALARYTSLLTLPQPNKDFALANVEIWRGFVDASAYIGGNAMRDLPLNSIGTVFTAFQRESIFEAYKYITTVQARLVLENKAEMDRLLAQSPLGDDPIFIKRKEDLERNHTKKMNDLASSMGRLGLLLALLGDREKSSGAFGAALAINNNNKDVWLQYAQTLTAVGDNARAKAVFDYLIAAQGTTPPEFVNPRPPQR